MSAKKTASSAKKTEPETFEDRDVVLAKIRGFPPWPGMVVDPSSVPKAVAKERPQTKTTRAVYAVRFFPAGDYAWLPPRELTRLSTSAINGFLKANGSENGKGRKGGELAEGYRNALDPSAWEGEHAANPPAAKKRKTKSKSSKKRDDDEEDEDELADEGGEEEAEDEEEEKAGRKRKRASSPAAAKVKAKPKAKAAAAGAKAKKGGKAKKSKAAVESEEDEAGEQAEAEAEDDGEGRASKKSKAAPADDATAQYESDPEAVKVREWRHKLQKTFLSSKTLPKEDEMPAVDALFTTVESYEGMNIGYLTFSKIGKVMRHIHLLEAPKVPRDEEFNFRDRAKALVDKWHTILNSSKTAPEGSEAPAGADAEAGDVNGADVNGAGDLTVLDVTMDEA